MHFVVPLKTFSFVLAMAAMAQPVHAKPRTMSPAQSMFLLNVYATCLVDRYEGRAESLIRSDYGSPQYATAMKFFDEEKSGYCVIKAGKFRVKPQVLRGAISETLLRRRYANVALPTDQSLVVPAAVSAGTIAHVQATADCVVRSRPALMRSLFAVRAHSSEETELLKQVDETAKACTTDKTFSKQHREVRRGLLGEAKFKWAETVFGVRKSQRL